MMQPPQPCQTPQPLQITNVEIINQSASRSIVCHGQHAGDAKIDGCNGASYRVIKYTAASSGSESMSAPATEGLLSRLLVHPNVVRTYGWKLVQVQEEDLSGDLAAAMRAAAKRRNHHKRQECRRRLRGPQRSPDMPWPQPLEPSFIITSSSALPLQQPTQQTWSPPPSTPPTRTMERIRTDNVTGPRLLGTRSLLLRTLHGFKLLGGPADSFSQPTGGNGGNGDGGGGINGGGARDKHGGGGGGRSGHSGSGTNGDGSRGERNRSCGNDGGGGQVRPSAMPARSACKQ